MILLLPIAFLFLAVVVFDRHVRGKLVSSKCPMCGERRVIERASVGQESECANCRQVVRLIPKSTVRLKVEYWLFFLASLAAMWLGFHIYQSRLDSLTGMFTHL